MKVQIIGLGYIGLPTAGIIADAGNTVHGYDVSAFVIESINSGNLHVEEKGLSDLIERVKGNGSLSVSLGVEEADYHIICVPTPFKKEKDNHVPDISYILNAVISLAPVIRNGDTIILESTSPVGTTEVIAKEVKKLRKDLKIAGLDSGMPDVFFAYCPERIIPGDMIRELMENDRVIGGIDSESAEKTYDLYKTFVKGKCLRTTARTAEMAKLTENAFRDVNIAFANELSLICDRLELNVNELITLCNHHPRVNILCPGPGVGGHCIAVDPWFIVDSAPEEAQLIAAARNINNRKPHFVIEKVAQAVANDFTGRILCFGLTYKPNVNDFRESPSLFIAEKLTEEYGPEKVIGIDPFIKHFDSKKKGFLNLHEKIDKISENDLVLGLVHHSEFDAVSIPEKCLVLDFCRMIK